MRSRFTKALAAATLGFALPAGAAVVPASGFAVRTYPTPDFVAGAAIRQGNAILVGQGTFGSGGQSIVRLEGGRATTIVTGFSSLGGFDLDGGDLYTVDNCFGADFGCGNPGTGDTLYRIDDALTRTDAAAAGSSEVLAPGTFATPQDVLVQPGGTVLVADAVGVGAGRVTRYSGGIQSNFATGLDFLGGLATDGATVFVANVDGSFTGSIRRYDLVGTPLAPLVGGLSGAYAVAVDGGNVLVTGGFTNDFSSSTLLAVNGVGATSERAHGFGFSGEVFHDASRGAALVLDFGVSEVAAVCADANGDAVCDADLASPAPVVKGRLKLGRQLTPPGDDTLSFKGQITIPLVPVLDPATNGAKVLVDDAAGRVIVDVVVPPGAYVPATRTGWVTSSSGTSWTYKNPAGFLGVTTVKVKRVASVPGLVKFTVKGKRGHFDASGATLPLQGVFALGQAGQGGLALFPGPTPACAIVGGGNTVNCR